MLHSVTCAQGMVTAPHHLASEAGLRVLREGGNAIEAMLAAAAAIAVVYPHMNAIGGDGFWLVHAPGSDPVGIDACGAAAGAATPVLYRDQGFDTIPSRGPLAANTAAATIAGWQAALTISHGWGGRMALGRLFEDAIHYAAEGFAPSASQIQTTAEKRAELESVPGFAEAFLVEGKLPRVSERFTQPRLAATLRALEAQGLDGFYRGRLAAAIASDLAAVGSPVSAADLESCRAAVVAPLSLRLSDATLYNMPPPTQGLASLMILGLYERIAADQADGFDHLHRLVEATKQAFLVRDAEVTDPAHMTSDPASFLAPAALERLATRIDPARALPWPAASNPGDTIWMGAVDRAGRSVSFIQSIYWEFGSGVVLPETGILWQNRGASFQLEPAARQALVPGRKPFHTLNPALALFDDGRRMVYGAMGGEGQPQTQAAVFTRYARHGQSLQRAVTAPRWLLGRTWGAETTSLKLESDFPPELIERLRAAGHEVELVSPFNDIMGHAGGIVRSPDGVLEGAADPRSDGQARGF